MRRSQDLSLHFFNCVLVGPLVGWVCFFEFFTVFPFYYLFQHGNFFYFSTCEMFILDELNTRMNA